MLPKYSLCLSRILLLLACLFLLPYPWGYLFRKKLDLLVNRLCANYFLWRQIIYSHFCIGLRSLMSCYIFLRKRLLLNQTCVHSKILLINSLLISHHFRFFWSLLKEIVKESFSPLIKIFTIFFDFKLATLRVFVSLRHALTNYILIFQEKLSLIGLSSAWYSFLTRRLLNWILLLFSRFSSNR